MCVCVCEYYLCVTWQVDRDDECLACLDPYVTYSQASVSVFTCLFSVFFFHYLSSLSYFQKYKQALKSIPVRYYFILSIYHIMTMSDISSELFKFGFYSFQ